jgi:hypothetical protein
MGFKLHAAKYSSRAPIEQLAAFYREALATHGTVIDCSSGKPVALPSSAASRFPPLLERRRLRLRAWRCRAASGAMPQCLQPWAGLLQARRSPRRCSAPWSCSPATAPRSF